MRRQFDEAYRQRFSFLMPDRRLIVDTVSVEAISAGRSPCRIVGAAMRCARVRWCRPRRSTPTSTAAGREHRFIVARTCGRAIASTGPAIVAEANATTVVDPGWRAEVTDLDHLVLRRVAPRAAARAIGTTVDPVMLEVFNNLFMSIAEQMGLRLQNTAYSVNIKERLDFSCALFDAEGNLIANAPHMPVHLGSMSESIKTVIRENAGRMSPATST